MLKPTIHSNGTSREDLLNRVLCVANALEDAMTALNKATPNGRDYYPQDPGAIKIALEEHNARATKIQEVIDDMRSLAEHICDA